MRCGARAPEHRSGTRAARKLPAYDALTARSQRDNGAPVELLRTYPGSLVNSHVALWFVVWGRRASHLISKQPWSYAFGRSQRSNASRS